VSEILGVASAEWLHHFYEADTHGRALGRVLAHEVVHMLTGNSGHAHEGVTRRALSGNQLIAPKLRLAPEDLDRLIDSTHK